jgi:HEAT repeat protein
MRRRGNSVGERTIRFGQSVPAILLLVLASAAPARCQQVTDATLTIRFANDQRQFHVGETIPLELAFSSTAEKTYEFDGRNYDRSTRLNVDEFHVTPPGRDPLYNYYHSGLLPFGEGVEGSGFSLGSQPRIVREDLNEWVALDHPGQYAIYATSSRVSRLVGSNSQPVELRSNTLYFEIVAADAAWREQTLGTAVAALNNPDSSPDEKRSAIRALRFLGSPESVHELVKVLGTPGNEDSWDCLAGLFGFPNQRLVLNELDKQFSSPDMAITPSYVTALVGTGLLVNRKPSPLYATRSQVQAENEEKARQFREAWDTVYVRAAAVVAAKQGRAKAETVRMLLGVPEGGASSSKPWQSLSGDTLASAFVLLPPAEQAGMLQEDWDRLKVPAMADALESVLDQAQIDDSRLRGLALERLYALDPDDGAARILEEIRQPHGDMANSSDPIPVLGLLPNKTLPQFDDLLANRLEKASSVPMGFTARLIGRYSTKAILSRVKAVYQREQVKWDCRFADGLMTYFLRVDPDFGVRQMRDAPNLCMSDAFRALVKMGRWPEVEPTIIGKLDDPNVQTARQAADVLRKYGGEKAEGALWGRLQRLHEQWATRLGELRYRPNMPPAALDAMGLQEGLVEALGRAQHWLLDENQLGQLERMTFGTDRSMVAQWHWKSPLLLGVNFTYDGQLQVDIDGIYSTTDVIALCAKLAQFPEGTQFRVIASGPRDRLGPVMQAIEDAAQEDGLDLKLVN